MSFSSSYSDDFEDATEDKFVMDRSVLSASSSAAPHSPPHRGSRSRNWQTPRIDEKHPLSPTSINGAHSATPAENQSSRKSTPFLATPSNAQDSARSAVRTPKPLSSHRAGRTHATTPPSTTVSPTFKQERAQRVRNWIDFHQSSSFGEREHASASSQPDAIPQSRPPPDAENVKPEQQLPPGQQNVARHWSDFHQPSTAEQGAKEEHRQRSDVLLGNDTLSYAPGSRQQHPSGEWHHIERIWNDFHPSFSVEQEREQAQRRQPDVLPNSGAVSYTAQMKPKHSPRQWQDRANDWSDFHHPSLPIKQEHAQHHPDVLPPKRAPPHPPPPLVAATYEMQKGQQRQQHLYQQRDQHQQHVHHQHHFQQPAPFLSPRCSFQLPSAHPSSLPSSYSYHCAYPNTQSYPCPAQHFQHRMPQAGYGRMLAMHDTVDDVGHGEPRQVRTEKAGSPCEPSCGHHLSKGDPCEPSDELLRLLIHKARSQIEPSRESLREVLAEVAWTCGSSEDGERLAKNYGLSQKGSLAQLRKIIHGVLTCEQAVDVVDRKFRELVQQVRTRPFQG